jgi:acyl-CoA thioesterase FadM
MNLYFRLFWLLIRGLCSKKNLNLLDKCTTSFWVNPLDLDINFHMNNGRYLSIMDLARTDLMLKSGVFSKLFLQGYYPVVLSESIRFRKSLAPFNFFSVETQIEAWNEKDFYLLQTFVHKGETVAEGYIKGRFLKRGHKGSIPTKDLFAVVGINLDLRNATKRAEAQDQIDSLLVNKKIY